MPLARSLHPHFVSREQVKRTGYVLVSEFQLTERDLADPAAFVAALTQSIEDVEEEEP